MPPAQVRKLFDLSGSPTQRLRAGALLVRASWRLILQSTLAAGLAFFVARMIGHVDPFFAPTSAVAALAISLGSRMRRTAELVLGNVLGVALAEILVVQIGTGGWQVALVVPMAICGALLLGGGSILVIQSTSAAIFIATVPPPVATPVWNTGRVTDAFIGGTVGLLVSALVLPVSPTAHAHKATTPLLAAMSGGLREIAAGLRDSDAARANRALDSLRNTRRELEDLHAAIDATREVIRVAPWYWSQKWVLMTYGLAGYHLDHAVRNCRVLARQATVAIDRNEDVGPVLPDAIDQLALGVEALTDVLNGASPTHARELVVNAVHSTSTGPPPTGLFGPPMVAQLRLTASDLLQATDLTVGEAASLIRSVDGSVELG